MDNEDFSLALHNALAEAYGMAQRDSMRSGGMRVELLGITIERVVLEIPAAGSSTTSE